MADLAGKIALVTGGAQGLGRGIALVLAEQGADIILNDKDFSPSAEAVMAEIENLGRRVWFKAADVSKEAAVTAMFDFIKEKTGRLDILVNNAGTSQDKNIYETSLEEWNFILQTNLTSCFLCSKEAMVLMAKQKQGRIINISSVVGQQGALFGHVHYAASKSGILGITKTLARTGAPDAIRVNAIAPGIIETDLLRTVHGGEGVAKLAANVPLGLGSPRAVGLAVAFLCGEGGDYITGTTLDVNGGLYFR